MPEAATLEPEWHRPAANPEIVALLSENPDGILEQIADRHAVSTFDVVNALAEDHAAIVSSSSFEAVFQDLTGWGDVMMIVHTPNIVLECKGPIPPGSFGRGYFNIHGDSPIGGHIKAERCRHIAFVSRPFMGRPSCSIQFFDEDGHAMFKIFVGRDEERNLRPDQVERFESLRQTLCG
ncbi:MAG: heme utilization cystosolic carrier protein HutX [Pseudomonadota bacterium]